jgi:hypothetical protein
MKQILVVFVLLLGANAQTAPLVFGVHTNRLGSWPIQVPFDVWRSLNATSKSGSVKWAGIQTGANTYDFGTLDQAMEQAASANVAVIYTPYATPAFIANTHGFQTDGSGIQNCVCGDGVGTTGCNPPSDLAGDGSGTNATWQNFITNLATHVHSQHVANPTGYADISYWETGNEYLVNPKQWCGSFPQLDRMMQDMKCIVTGTGPGCTATAINPDAQIMTVAITAKKYGNKLDIAYLNSLANVSPVQTPEQLADVLDIHCYLAGTDTPEGIIAEVQSLQTLTAKPFYCTEGGWQRTHPPTTWAHSADWMGRFMLSVASTGVIGFDFFQYDGYLTNTATGPGSEVLWAKKNPPNNYFCSIPASPGFFCPPEVDWTAIYQWTRNITFAQACTGQPVKPRGNIWTCDHTSTGGTYTTGKFLWFDVLDKTAQYTVPAGFSEEFEIDGSSEFVTPGQILTLTNSPILLTNGSLRARSSPDSLRK